MSFLENCFNTMLEYGEAVKNSFVKGHTSDWPEEKSAEVETPEEIVPGEDVVPGEDEVIEDVTGEPAEEGEEIPE
jgi:hypothetical protein